MSGLQRVLGLGPTHPARKGNAIILALLVLALLLALVLLATDAGPLATLLSLILAASLFLLWIIGLLGGRQYERDAENMQAGRYLVRWRFSPSEWEHIAKSEWLLARKQARREAIMWAVLFPLIAIIPAVIIPFKIYPTGIAVLVIIGLLVGMVLLGSLLALPTYLASNSILTQKPTLGKPRTIYVSELGVYSPWGYRPIRVLNLKLSSAEIEEGDPSVLVLKSIQWTFADLTGSYHQRQTIRVPIPRGHEAEARQLIETLMGS